MQLDTLALGQAGRQYVALLLLLLLLLASPILICF